LAEKLVKDNPVIGVKAPREKREVGSTINYLSLEELQQIFDRIAPTLKIRGDKTREVQMLRDTATPYFVTHFARLYGTSRLSQYQNVSG